MNGSLKERAYNHIYQKLIDGELPPGARLSNRALAAEIGVSIIPVREAISQLQSGGFVEHRSGVGSFVPCPSYEDLFELYDLREAVECHAAAKAAESINSADIAELAGCIDESVVIIQELGRSGRSKRDPELLARWSNVDARFHDAVMLAAGNRRALETVRSLRSMSRIFGRQVAYEPLRRLRQTLAEHRRVLEALDRADPEEAHRAMADHIRSGCQLVLSAHRRGRLATGRDKSHSGRLETAEQRPGGYVTQ